MQHPDSFLQGTSPAQPLSFRCVLVLVLLMALPWRSEAGMGDEAMTSVKSLAAVPSVGLAISREVPNRPLKGQGRPLCARFDAEEINGGCWWLPKGADIAPCNPLLYEHEGRCYTPVMLPERQPTSSKP